MHEMYLMGAIRSVVSLLRRLTSVGHINPSLNLPKINHRNVRTRSMTLVSYE